MYARFYTKALADLGYAPKELREPFKRLFTQGMIRLGGAKMSKSKGNLEAPDAIIDAYGADSLRLAHLFVGPPADDVDWETVGIDGTSRFLRRVWRLAIPDSTDVPAAAPEAEERILRETHRVIQRVDDDFERWSYNTAVAALMEFTNFLYKEGSTADAIDALLLLLAPMAPHIAAELWERRHGTHVHEQSWPEADPQLAKRDTVTLVVQINGKLRDRIEVSAEITGEEAERLALASARVQEQLSGSAPRKVITKPPRLVNIVI
jgi:leucyl-tRNA synthetase